MLLIAVALRSSAAEADPPSLLDREVVLEALRLATERAGLSPGATAPLASRARNAAWLPQVTVRVARNTGAAVTQYATTTGDRQMVDDSLYLDVRVSLSLDRLVFDPHEVTLWRYEQQRAERRRQLEGAVFDALAALEQLRAQRAAEPPDAPAALPWRIAYARARARVEMLTGVALEALWHARAP